MPRRFFVLLAVAALWLASCASVPPGQRLQEQLPATYAGVLPCADCPGIDVQLDLRADHSYFLRRSYRERDGEGFDELGVWSLSADERVLILQGGDDQPALFALADDAGLLRRLDRDGNPIASPFDDDLRRVEAPRPLEPRLQLQGMVSYPTDEALFEECRTGLRLPIAAGPAAALLESAYRRERRMPGEPLLAALEGRIAVRQPMAGEPREMLVVDRFIEVRPGQRCPPRGGAAPLLDTHWRLVQLGVEPVYSGAGQRAPSLQLLADQRVVGFSGCNRMTGDYRLDELTLRFSVLATTRRGCPGSAVLEQTFLMALNDARRWNILGRRLELYAEDGTRLARFEAQAPPTRTRVPAAFPLR